MISDRKHLLVGFALLLIASTVAARLLHVRPVQSGQSLAVAQSVYLSDLEWEQATTGWVAIANDGLPARDMSFTGGPISIAGVEYAKGLGTYPVSEITYDLNREYQTFEAAVGLDDEVPEGAGGVEFMVFVDEALLYRSGIVRSDEPARDVKLNVAGAQTLRLVVTDASDGLDLNYADWAEARLSRVIMGSYEDPKDDLQTTVQNQLRERRHAREADEEQASARATSEIDSLCRFLDTLSPEQDGSVDCVMEGTAGTLVRAGYDERRGLLVAGNERLMVTLGLGGESNGTLSLLDLRTRSMRVENASPVLKLSADRVVSFERDSLPNGYEIIDISDPVFGHGKAVEGRYTFPQIGSEARLEVSLFDRAPYALYQIFLTSSSQPDSAASLVDSAAFKFFSLDSGAFFFGKNVEYIADLSRIRRGVLRDDGVLRREAVDLGKPIFLRDRESRKGLILALIGETRSLPEFEVITDPGRFASRLALASQAMVGASAGSESVASPRLYVELTDSDDLRHAFGNFKNIMQQLYPPAPLPNWVKYQWLSWYPYYMDIDEAAIKRQIDYIAENLGDLGPWSVLIDAGWYVAEGREGSDWRNVDPDKFPSGLRALVDYAHSRDVMVILYFSSPYLDSRERPGDWLGLKELIDRHRDWLFVLGEDESRKSFAYDFSNPDVQEYMRNVLRDFFLKYDVDGIKIDGLGNAEGAILDRERLNAFGMVDKVAGQTMSIYRFIYENARSIKKNIYVESGWLTPLFASPYAHTFRYGDERVTFSGRYPFPGLVEHIDYAAFQKAVLGQRPNMGAIYDDPNVSVVNQWWLQGGLALGTQVVLSFDLPQMTDDVLNEYRELLVHYNAFQGETRFGENFESHGESFGPGSFATISEPYIFLGVVNREKQDKLSVLRLADFGIVEGTEYAALDVNAGRYYKTSGTVSVHTPAKSFRLILLRRSPGVMWTNSSFREMSNGQSVVEFVARGPKAVEGFAEVIVPEPRSVSVDAVELVESRAPTIDEGHYFYDRNTGILKLKYSHDGPRRILITY